MIIFYILTTLSLDNVWTLLGENCCWSLLGLKGLMLRKKQQQQQNQMHLACIAGFERGRGLHLPCTEAKPDVLYPTALI